MSTRHPIETLKRSLDFFIRGRRSTRRARARCLLLSIGVSLLGLSLNGLQAQTVIPSTFVLPSSSADPEKPGFNWRIHQVGTSQIDSTARTEAHLAGLLGVNIADPNAQSIA